MNAPTIRGLTSIIVPCWNQLEFTRQCIAALRNHTRPPWELIVVDNGSTDGTAAYLAGVRDTAAVPVTVVSNATNLGFPAAINQGLRLARGEYLVMLNNDVVVTDAWLDQLIALANAKTRNSGGHAGTNGLGSVDWARRAVPGRMSSLSSHRDRTSRSSTWMRTGRAKVERAGATLAAVGTNVDQSDDMVVAGSKSTPPVPSADMVVASSESTPPGPPSRGGESGAAESAGLVGPRGRRAEACPLTACCLRVTL